MVALISPSLGLGPLGLLFLSASFVSAVPTPHDSPSVVARAVPMPTKYVAFGDSFAAGIGAGHEFGSVHVDGCHRYDKGYPSQLQAQIDGHPIADENFKACTGAKAAQIKEQAIYLDSSVDLATISIGGNNVGFADIVNDCIYRFKGVWSDALNEFMRPEKHHENLRIFVTGYAKFFNSESSQCNDVSWNYWQKSPENGSGDKMTNQIRRDLNSLVDLVNSKIDEAVNSYQDARIQFINYDDTFDTHRFCEDRFTEPQRPKEQRLDLYMHQYNTPDGQLEDDGSVTDADTDDSKALAQGMLDYVNSDPDAKVAEPFDEQPIDISLFPVRISSGLMKVFHPTQAGHFVIAQQVWNAYMTESALQPEGLQPLSENFPIGDSGQRVSGNFPRVFQLDDGKQTVAEILLRMRQEACQGLCDQVNAIPSDLLAHKRVNENGCEFVTKISAGKELFLSATHSGQNCWDATQRMVDERMTDNGEPIFTESWVNGGEYEFYNVGVRDFNTLDIGSTPSHHLGHIHVACRRWQESFWDRFEIYTSDWDDGNWGKSILESVKGCNLSPTKWRFEDAPSKDVSEHTFEDGTMAQKWAKWRMAIAVGAECAEGKIEEAIGLRGGGLDCPDGEWSELDMFK
ncbi:hypothetical protein G7Z17_g5044 [Cylindrodendrum hubeiense]|uniref:SGNH hydrolase-type esterase domain-containing protein n=1 Tax=Cylindrodendrum hubeiense TaxID=595255 RepID=A0A9P5HBM3_9HYPO|nr:hypothetical protein G7Z17_g5044 [Cylindrodendrum hubeiense]